MKKLLLLFALLAFAPFAFATGSYPCGTCTGGGTTTGPTNPTVLTTSTNGGGQTANERNWENFGKGAAALLVVCGIEYGVYGLVTDKWNRVCFYYGSEPLFTSGAKSPNDTSMVPATANDQSTLYGVQSNTKVEVK